MNRMSRRAGRFRHIFAFAALALAAADPALASTPDLSFHPSTLAFSYQIAAALPAGQTLQIKSTGAALSFTLSTTGPLPYSAQWLSISANAGTTPASIKVYVNPTGLPSGSYSGTIVVNAPDAATTTQNFAVTLDVGDAPATLTANATSLTFNWVSGNALPASQAIVLMSSGGALSASIAVSGGTWLSASPNASITLVGLPGSVNVSVNPSSLAPGTYTGKITFSSPNAANKSLIVSVTLNVSAGVPTVTNVWPPGVLVNSSTTVVTLTGTNFFPTSTAAIGSTNLTTTVLSGTSLLVTIPVSLLTTAQALSIVVITPTAAAPSSGATFTVYPPGPQVFAVANSASYTTSTVSPGGIITIYGVGLGPATLALFPGTDPIPTSLPTSGSATSVTIDGNAAPLLYASATQVSCITPYAVAAKSGSQVDLVLTYSGTISSAFKVNAVDADPGIFTLDASGAGPGAILNYNATTGNYSLNSPANPATKGSIVVIYATGFGQTNPAGDETHLISGSVVPVAQIGVTIDGQAATVQSATEPAGSVPGVLQINATIPANASSGKAIPVVVTAGTAQSQGRVTLAVK